MTFMPNATQTEIEGPFEKFTAANRGQIKEEKRQFIKLVAEQLFIKQTLLIGKVNGGYVEVFLVPNDVNSFVFVDSIQNIWCYFRLHWLLTK